MSFDMSIPTPVEIPVSEIPEVALLDIPVNVATPAPVESLTGGATDVANVVPELTAGKKRKLKKCKIGSRRNRTTGKCQRSYSRSSLRKQLDFAINSRNRLLDEGGVSQPFEEGLPFLGPLRPSGMYGGAKKRSLSKYNMFVKNYHSKHRSLKGKSFIRSAAKAWNACKRSGSSKCKKTRSRK